MLTGLAENRKNAEISDLRQRERETLCLQKFWLQQPCPLAPEKLRIFSVNAPRLGWDFLLKAGIALGAAVAFEAVVRNPKVAVDKCTSFNS